MSSIPSGAVQDIASLGPWYTPRFHFHGVFGGGRYPPQESSHRRARLEPDPLGRDPPDREGPAERDRSIVDGAAALHPGVDPAPPLPAPPSAARAGRAPG